MAAAHTKPMEAQDWAALFFMGFIWGSSYLFAHIAVNEIPPLTLVFLRVGLASIALCLVMAWQGLSFGLLAAHWKQFVVLGLLHSALPFFFIFYSQKFIGPGIGGILNATAPIFTVPLAHFLTHDEKFIAKKVVGVLLGFFGVVVLIGADAFQGAITNVTAAELIMLGAPVGYALGNIYGRRFKNVPPLATTTGGLLASTVITLPLSLLIDNSLSLPMPSLYIWGCIFSLAFLSTALAFIFYYRLLARVGATDASLVAYLIPVSAIILGVIFKGETFSFSDLAGMAIIGLSLAIIDGRFYKKLRKRKPATGDTIPETTLAD